MEHCSNSQKTLREGKRNSKQQNTFTMCVIHQLHKQDLTSGKKGTGKKKFVFQNGDN
jgi:hypothetical protein